MLKSTPVAVGAGVFQKEFAHWNFLKAERVVKLTRQLSLFAKAFHSVHALSPLASQPGMGSVKFLFQFSLSLIHCGDKVFKKKVALAGTAVLPHHVVVRHLVQIGNFGPHHVLPLLRQHGGFMGLPLIGVLQKSVWNAVCKHRLVDRHKVLLARCRAVVGEMKTDRTAGRAQVVCGGFEHDLELVLLFHEI